MLFAAVAGELLGQGLGRPQRRRRRGDSRSTPAFMSQNELQAGSAIAPPFRRLVVAGPAGVACRSARRGRAVSAAPYGMSSGTASALSRCCRGSALASGGGWRVIILCSSRSAARLLRAGRAGPARALIASMAAPASNRAAMGMQSREVIEAGIQAPDDVASSNPENFAESERRFRFRNLRIQYGDLLNRTRKVGDQKRTAPQKRGCHHCRRGFDWRLHQRRQMDRAAERLLDQVERVDDRTQACELAVLEAEEGRDAHADRAIGVVGVQRTAQQRRR